MSQSKTVREWRAEALDNKAKGDAYTIVANIWAVENPVYASKQAISHFARALHIQLGIKGLRDDQTVEL